MALRLISMLVLVTFAFASTSQRTVVVSGATGRTGALLYKRLKKDGSWNVRALVRNATKAKDLLGCSACDEKEGIFIGDVTQPASLKAVMAGADVLAITTASFPVCTGLPPPLGKCTYHEGADPKSIDWQGTRAQVAAFGSAGGNLSAKQILYVSTMDTTVPDNFLDKMNNGHVSFYHLQAEVSILSSGIPFTIVKACGLGDDDSKAGKNKLIIGHDDSGFSLALNHMIQRDDVARVLVEAVRNPQDSKGLRFDICSSFFGKATTDSEIVQDVLKAARWPWQKSARATSQVVV